MKKAIYAGSFDPITLGHLDIMTRASQMFELTLVVASSDKKKYLFSLNERFDLLSKTTNQKYRIILCEDMLLANLCKSLDIGIIVRGLRNTTDFEFEKQMAQFNKDMGIETVFIMADPKYAHISSSSIKEILKYDGDVSGYVSKYINDKLKEKK